MTLQCSIGSALAPGRGPSGNNKPLVIGDHASELSGLETPSAGLARDSLLVGRSRAPNDDRGSVGSWLSVVRGELRLRSRNGSMRAVASEARPLNSQPEITQT